MCCVQQDGLAINCHVKFNLIFLLIRSSARSEPRVKMNFLSRASSKSRLLSTNISLLSFFLKLNVNSHVTVNTVSITVIPDVPIFMAIFPYGVGTVSRAE